MLLANGELNTNYKVKRIDCEDKDMINFLLTLGCYEGEDIIILSKLEENYIVKIKDARYSIDMPLVNAIVI